MVRTSFSPARKGNRVMLLVLAALLMGIAVFLGLGARTAETQTTPVQPTYEMKELGTLGGGCTDSLGTVGTCSYAFGINDSGQVVGESARNDGAIHAFLYDESATPKMQDLGTLGGTDSSVAESLNDSGQVVGYSYLIGDTTSTRAFFYENGQMMDLNTLVPAGSGWTLTEAYGINSYGQIAVTGTNPGVGTHALLLTPKGADTAPPIISGLPSPDLTAKATSASGASVTFPSSITASDAVDGAVPVSCASASGLKSGDTFPLGETTVNCMATDAAGNTAQASFPVKVLYDFGNGSGGGFSAPVSSSVLNTVKAGRGVPVKFGLGDDFGLDIFAQGYPTSRKIACDTGLPTAPVEETLAVSASGLHYDASTGQYVYNWKTDRGWSVTCRELVLKFKDGTEHTAKFQFTK